MIDSNKLIKEFNPLISIIVNCYNGEKYLENSISSILDQTYSNWEIIFWDNKSTDNSVKIINKFKINDDRINIFTSNRHTSLNEARNLAIHKSKGDFLTFLDVDDLWIKEKLQLQIELFKEEKIGFAYGNFFEFDDYTNKKKVNHNYTLPDGFITKQLVKGLTIGLLTIMIRKSILNNKETIFDPRFTVIGDIILTREISLENKVAVINIPIAFYRKHNSNFTTLFPNKYFEEFDLWISNIDINSNFYKSIFFNIQKTTFYEEKAFYFFSLKDYTNTYKVIKKITNLKTKSLLYLKITFCLLFGYKLWQNFQKKLVKLINNLKYI